MAVAIEDQYLSPGLVRAAAATWPDRTWGNWHHYECGKLASKSPHGIPVAVNAILTHLAELPVDKMIGCRQAFPDLEYLHGAGLHQMDAGGSLGLHLDTERHPVLPWRREATAILYLDGCSGGELDLTDASGNVLRQVAPESNRLVVFSTPGQYHRVNECRSTRRSVCLFFWSVCEEEVSGCRRAKFVE